jgi:hypothetical protein
MRRVLESGVKELTDQQKGALEPNSVCPRITNFRGKLWIANFQGRLIAGIQLLRITLIPAFAGVAGKESIMDVIPADPGSSPG